MSRIVIGFEWMIMTSVLAFKVCLFHILSMTNYDFQNDKYVTSIWIKIIAE